MKNIFVSLLLVFGLTTAFAQAPAPAQKGATYGEKITADGAIPATQLAKKMGGSDSMNAKVSGKIVEVCQKKGCFMKMELANGETMMIRFKDYGFFMPFDIPGKTVVMNGVAKQELISVDDQVHYAEDAKKSEQEIAKIKAPKKELTFEANGVLVL